MTRPTPAFVDFALLSAAFALAQMVKSVGDYFEFDFGGADVELETILRTEFEAAK
jgi:hypothetical protein